MKFILLAGVAGFVGTILRFTAMRAMNHALPGFPWGTLAVNVAGSFVAGFCFVVFRAKLHGYEPYFPVFFVGFLGAFTTFSTFTLETMRYLSDAQYGKFFLNLALQNFGGLSAAGLGLWIARIFVR